MDLIEGWSDRPKIYADRELAHEIGYRNAVILQRIMWSISAKTEDHRKEYFHDDHWWMGESVPELAKSTSFGEGAIKRGITELKKLKLIVAKKRVGAAGNKSNLYRHDWEAIADLIGSKRPDKDSIGSNSTGPKQTDRPVQNDPIDQSEIDRSIGSKRTDLSKSLKESSKSQLRVLPTSPPKPIPAEDLELGKRWSAYAQQARSLKKPPDARKYGEDLGKVRRYVKKTYDYDANVLDQVLDFVKEHDFWKKLATSPGTLLKKSKNDPEKRKIDHILEQLKQAKEVKKYGNSGQRFEEPVKNWGNDDKPWEM